MTAEEESMIDAMEDQAEADIAQMRKEGRWGPSEGAVAVGAAALDTAEDAKVSMQWSRSQLEIVQRAAELFGMPYQTYVKQAAFRQALDDLVKVRAAASRDEKGAA